MSISIHELAARVGGTVVGAADGTVAGAATLETAGPADVTLVDSPERLHLLGKSRAGAAIVPAGSGPLDRPSIEVPDVHAAFTAAVTHFRPPRPRPRTGVSPKADIHPTARLAADVDVGPFATVGPPAGAPQAAERGFALQPGPGAPVSLGPELPGPRKRSLFVRLRFGFW